MKRRKWKRLLIVTGLILLAGLGAGYWAMNLAVNKVLDAVAPDALASVMQNSPSTPLQATPTPSPATVTPSPVGTSGQSPEASKNIALSISSPPSTTSESVSPTATPSSAIPTVTPYSGAIDAGKAESAQENITMKDKLQVTSIFMKRFSSSELDAFMKLASGGLTIEEKREAKKIVMQKLSEDEYNQLIEIAAKLGLSQGRKYDESKEDFQAKQP